MSVSAQTMQQRMPSGDGGAIMGSLSEHPVMIAALIGGAVGLFVLLKSGGGGSAPSSDSSGANIQVASLQDQLLRFSGEQSLRDQTTQNAISGLGSSLGAQIQETGQTLAQLSVDETNALAIGNSVTANGLATYLQQLIVAYGGNQKTPAERDAIVNQWKQMFSDTLAKNDALYEAGDGSAYRQWLAIRNAQDPTRQTYTAFV